MEAARLEKGGGQQRLAANRDQGRGAGRKWDGSRKQGFNENKLIRTRQGRGRAERVPVEKKLIVLTDSLTIKDLAEKMSIKAADVIKRLMEMGTMATINQEIDVETAAIILQEFGFPVEIKREEDVEALQLESEAADDLSSLAPRPPVVVVMGHVDHGKTSLLDAIRDTNVTATEHGGITQHIGAYQVQHKGKRITFLDTPGHEAFTAMRARGASVTDIAILVVAADDGVKPQTVEAINHARAAGIPIIVAINKIDKPDANPERVKQQLTEHGLLSEEWGGDTIMVPVSALTHQGLGDLLEMVLLVAEMSELRANPNRPARGTIIESRLDKGRGPVATVLVQNGTLKSGDALVAGSCFARVRAMMDYKGRRVKKAGPSTPVEVLGFSEVPAAGDTFFVTDDEKLAREIADKRQLKKRQDEFRASGRLSLEDVFKRIQEGEVKELPLILKADVQGSVEALAQALERLNTGEVKVQIIHQGVGAISETDIMLASASNAVVIGFNVRPDVNARRAAEREKVDIHLYQVIYDAINDVRGALTGLLEPEYREVTIGQAEVRKVFRASKIGSIAGCYVLDGKISRDANVRVVRDGVLVHEGKLSSLKRFKDDVREVAQGYECGLTLENFNDIQEGDQLEFYTIETVRRELS
ncbi:MAG: translation initiation factor IF-2 [Thermoanaerobacterales bacterium]|nr:translation initiation factor IF-2 [Thermoanaerobacterales bacterium]